MRRKDLVLSTRPTTNYGKSLIVQAGPIVTINPMPLIITLPPEQLGEPEESLSEFLRIGRLYHPLCRNAFVQRVQLGYYAYERRDEWHTSALAAAYAGAFGPQSVERPDFSYSMAVWRLSQRVGFDISQRVVYGPTGRYQSLDKEMCQLVDEDLWTRAGVVDWLESLGV